MDLNFYTPWLGKYTPEQVYTTRWASQASLLP